MALDTSSDSSARQRELRSQLVDLVVDTQARRRTAHPAAIIVGAIAAFALAGATTGAAVAATGILSPPSSTAVDVTQLLNDAFVGQIENDPPPLVVTATGKTEVTVGARPVGAESLSVAVSCLDPGRFEIGVNGVVDSWLECDQGGGGAGEQRYAVDGEGPHTVSVVGTAGADYVIRVTWSPLPIAPPLSDAQSQAIADGVITREEYEEGLDRYVDCMAAAGWRVEVFDRDAPVIEYRFEGAGVDADFLCYEVEFYRIDSSWQASHE